MFDIRELIETGIEKGKDPKKLLELVADCVDDESDKIEIYEDLYDEIHGSHLCDKFCMKLVESMGNNSEKGKKWTIDQTNDIARKIGISFSNSDDYSAYEFWCAMHKEYYTHGESLKESNIDDVLLFGKFADDYLSNPNEPKGKLVDYFFWFEKNK